MIASVFIFCAGLFGRPMIEETPGGKLLLATGDDPPSAFPDDAAAEAAIARSIANAKPGSILSERESYHILDEPDRPVRKKRGRKTQAHL